MTDDRDTAGITTGREIGPTQQDYNKHCKQKSLQYGSTHNALYNTVYPHIKEEVRAKMTFRYVK